MRVLVIRAVRFGVHIMAPDFEKASYAAAVVPWFSSPVAGCAP